MKTTAQTVGVKAPHVSTLILDHVTRLDRARLEREIREAHPTMTLTNVLLAVSAAVDAQQQLMTKAIGIVGLAVKARGLS